MHVRVWLCVNAQTRPFKVHFFIPLHAILSIPNVEEKSTKEFRKKANWGWTNRWLDQWVLDGQTSGQANKLTDILMDRQTEKPTGGQIYPLLKIEIKNLVSKKLMLPDFKKWSLKPSVLKAKSTISNYHLLSKNTTWNSLNSCANRRSLGQIADFWWFSLPSEFFTKIITRASVHSTQDLYALWIASCKPVLHLYYFNDTVDSI